MKDSIHNEKILNFNAMVGNNNNNIALEFLTLANWDESEAARLYLDNVNVTNIHKIPNKYIKECYFEENNQLKIITFFKAAFKRDNSKCCYEFYGKIRGLVTSGINFINLLKINKGVIILYNLVTKNKLFEQLDMINRDQPNDYLNCSIIFPVINDSAEGDTLINQLGINRFPCYLFCKYKDDKIFYVVDKMEGVFYLELFKSSLAPEMRVPFNSNINLPQNRNNNIPNIQNNNKNYNSSINLNNNLKLPNQNPNFSVVKNDVKNVQNNYNYSNNNIEKKNLNNFKNDNKENHPKNNNNNHDFSIFNNNDNNDDNNNKNNNFPSFNKKENSDLPPPLNVYKPDFNNNIIKNNNINNNNNNNSQNYKNNKNNIYEDNKNISISQNYNNNIEQKNNNILQNNDNNKISINSNANREEAKKEKKEYVPDYRDYAFEDELVYNPLLDQYEKMSNVIQNLDKNNNKFNEPNIPMSDKDIRKNQDDEMRELERIEEERQRKIKEEKEKQKRIEEEEKERLKKEAEEKEIFSSLVPPEPDDSNPDKCVIIFRMPDGEKNLQRKFLKTEKISVLYDYIKSLGKEIYSDEEYGNFSIIQTFPFKNFEDKLNSTLEEEGLFPNSLLQIKLTN